MWLYMSDQVSLTHSSHDRVIPKRHLYMGKHLSLAILLTNSSDIHPTGMFIERMRDCRVQDPIKTESESYQNASKCSHSP